MEQPGRTFQLHNSVKEVDQRDGLWVVHKPARVLAHPNPPARRAGNAILRVPYDFAREAYESSGQPHDNRFAYLIHRLDQETSGLILLSFRFELASELKELFYHREVSKQYHALVQGLVDDRRGVWRDALRKRRVKGNLRVTTGGGRPNAETRFEVVRRFPALGATLLALFPETGRTHQLRVQSAARGYPIAGDERYGDFVWNRELRAAIGLRRMFLHAGRVELRHPQNGRRLKWVAELDRPLADPLERLKRL